MTTKEKEESGDDLGDWVIANNTPNLYLFGFKTFMKFLIFNYLY
jgi:hypothetical protein